MTSLQRAIAQRPTANLAAGAVYMPLHTHIGSPYFTTWCGRAACCMRYARWRLAQADES